MATVSAVTLGPAVVRAGGSTGVAAVAAVMAGFSKSSGGDEPSGGTSAAAKLASTSSTGAPGASSPTTAAPDVTTTTAMTVASTTTTTTSAPARSAAPATATQLEHMVQAIADSSGWDWRSAGVVIHIRYNPHQCCHWGVYDYRDASIWIGPSAFASTTRLRHVVLHELGHAWQWSTGRLPEVAADLAPWGYRGHDALEAGADCIATVWGSSPTAGHYWTCPSEAEALVARRLAGDWT